MGANKFDGPRDKCWGVEYYEQKDGIWYLNHLFWVGDDDEERVQEIVNGNCRNGVKIRMARWNRVGEYITAEE